MTYLAIVLISAATLLLELGLLRVFAVQQFYHFAFMAISLALLGAGASGSLLSIRRRPVRPAVISLIFAITTVTAYLVVNYVPFDSFSIAWDRHQIFYLAIYFLAAAAPFIFSGLVIGSELIRAGQRSHRVYGANLLGSAAGSLGSLLALHVVGDVGTVLLAALLGALAGLLFALVPVSGESQGRSSRRLALFALALTVAGVFLLFTRPASLALRLSPYKLLPVLSQAIGSEHVLTASTATARIDVVESETIHVMPGLSLNAPVSLPEQAGLLQDGDSLLPITFLSPDATEARALADNVPLGLAYRLRPVARTLVVEAGTGLDVLLALAAGSGPVTAVEDNGLIVETIRRHYGPETGYLFDRQDVAHVAQSARVFVRQPEVEGYGVVIVSLSDPHRPVTSGAYSLSEDYIYTVEAFQDYLSVLDDKGILVVTRWLQTPPSEAPRTFAAVVAAQRELGLDTERSLIAFRTLRTMTIIAGRQPFSAAEIETVRHFLETRGYDGVYFPGIRSGELNRYNVLKEPVYHDLFLRVLEQPETLFDTYRFDIRPPTDDHPFFFHFFKWRQTPEILAVLGQTWQPFGGSGYFVLVVLLLLVALAAFILIAGPLLLLRHASAPDPGRVARIWRLRVFGYFAAIGLAFLFVEVPLAQRFILVLSQPVIALSVVIFAILLFSGLGSFTVTRWSLERALLVLVAATVTYPLLLPSFAALALRFGAAARLLLSVVALAPLGYLMGLPFAAGLRVVEENDRSLIPWVWAINGSFSVISSVLAVMLALTWSLSAVLYLGAAAYGVAWLAFFARKLTLPALRV